MAILRMIFYYEHMQEGINATRHIIQLRSKTKGNAVTSIISSQLILLQSRKKWGIVYALATVVGLFCIPSGGLNSFILHGSGSSSFANGLILISKLLPLPIASFLILTGMYILNDLADADLDRSNGKKRPIAKGQVPKVHAGIFVILTNVTAVLLVLTTLSFPATLVALALVSMGVFYSAPKISLKDRFVLKTLSIAFAMMLCVMLGWLAETNWDTKYFANHDKSSSYLNSLLVCTYAALMLGIIVFITSLLNDLGDVEGDRAAFRRTIPIVIGRENTVLVSMFLVTLMIGVSWIFFYVLGNDLGPITPILVSLVAVLMLMNTRKTLKRLNDREVVRKQHKKSVPLHFVLHLAIIVGALLFWV